MEYCDECYLELDGYCNVCGWFCTDCESHGMDCLVGDDTEDWIEAEETEQPK